MKNKWGSLSSLYLLGTGFIVGVGFWLGFDFFPNIFNSDKIWSLEFFGGFIVCNMFISVIVLVIWENLFSYDIKFKIARRVNLLVFEVEHVILLYGFLSWIALAIIAMIYFIKNYL